MRICDKCQAPAVDKVSFQREREEFDLCLGCAGQIRDLIINQAPEEPTEEEKQGRRTRGPRKDKE